MTLLEKPIALLGGANFKLNTEKNSVHDNRGPAMILFDPCDRSSHQREGSEMHTKMVGWHVICVHWLPFVSCRSGPRGQQIAFSEKSVRHERTKTLA